ncbi:DUF5937 family protein [Streptomyces sp. NPDC059070]|uniref:DUF5937 family protein n=1 Tax=Streptomyces sp. NPDC059070 TaxID=3346713 RepID=UPI0036C4E569
MDDLADMRFACSPLLETATSLWALRRADQYAPHLPWVRRARAAPAAADGLDTALLAEPAVEDTALLAEPAVEDTGWIPDFITPRPASPLPDVRDELRRVRETPPEKALSDVRTAYAGRALPPRLAELAPAPRALRDAVAEAVEGYWEVAVAPHWPRMRAVLEADMVHRARLLAQQGAAALLTSLDPTAVWRDGELTLFVHRDLHLGAAVRGRGFWLVPTPFATHAVSPVGPDEPPTIACPAAGWCCTRERGWATRRRPRRRDHRRGPRARSAG